MDYGKHVIFTWIPSDIRIHGNTVVDQEAKDALDERIVQFHTQIINLL
jgi:hypothetical protein